MLIEVERANDLSPLNGEVEAGKAGEVTQSFAGPLLTQMTHRNILAYPFTLPFSLVAERRRSLCLTISLRSAAGRISKGPAFTPGCFDIN
jgi:hypothetical protein